MNEQIFTTYEQNAIAPYLKQLEEYQTDFDVPLDVALQTLIDVGEKYFRLCIMEKEKNHYEKLRNESLDRKKIIFDQMSANFEDLKNQLDQIKKNQEDVQKINITSLGTNVQPQLVGTDSQPQAQSQSVGSDINLTDLKSRDLFRSTGTILFL